MENSKVKPKTLKRLGVTLAHLDNTLFPSSTNLVSSISRPNPNQLLYNDINDPLLECENQNDSILYRVYQGSGCLKVILNFKEKNTIILNEDIGNILKKFRNDPNVSFLLLVSNFSKDHHHRDDQRRGRLSGMIRWTGFTKPIVVVINDQITRDNIEMLLPGFAPALVVVTEKASCQMHVPQSIVNDYTSWKVCKTLCKYGSIGLYLAMTGVDGSPSLTARDMVGIGLATHFVTSSALDQMYIHLTQTLYSTIVHEPIEDIVSFYRSNDHTKYCIKSTKSSSLSASFETPIEWLISQPALYQCFGEHITKMEDIMSHLKQVATATPQQTLTSQWAMKTYQRMIHICPLNLQNIFHMFKEERLKSKK
ncbi:hypothetical protein DFA_10031 [Cavenderia fasciculata]|uniref:Enoyl-CoA hydratase/isomerase domain-containing protein n=1 Tax=Cavenderia fasciculata TaxID=261658 RepID=F4Q932_CACFS|nr:uncharacterized protein DFA_10031 [Cavenderia fasciculata]EGG15201.1 hypothetical protein DFA_10031 [Cavenderia fasciculata]|eukprot:XP_004351921.1 hypothetical protein DFA_10031 [Cavenderia fasciculata]